MASHSCCRALCDHVRNLTDDQIRAMIQYGGYIGVNFYPRFLSADCKADSVTIAQHIDHICQLGGSDIVGIRQRFRRHRGVARRRAESGGAAESADGAAQLRL